GTDAEHEPQQPAAKRQGCRDRKIARDRRGDWLLREERRTEISARKTPEEADVLDGHRFIESEPAAHDSKRLVAGAGSGYESGDIAWHREVDREHTGRDHPNHERAPRRVPQEKHNYGGVCG